MFALSRGVLLTLVAIAAQPASAAGCPPDGYSREQLLELKAKDFATPDRASREALAVSLLPCLASVDPVLRDGVAFEALSTWMRGKQVTSQTAATLLDRLLPQLATTYPDHDGVARPFAALVLSEVARMDRIEPYLTDSKRLSLVSAAVAFEKSVRDYRGFDANVGWRHGVAHGADLLMQLGLNARVGKRELDELLGAVAAQVAPAGEHFYIYGEGGRLARAVFVIAQRKLHSQSEWQSWLQGATSPAPYSSWQKAFESQAGLAKVNNTNQFVRALYVLLKEESEAEVQARVVPPLVATMQTLP